MFCEQYAVFPPSGDTGDERATYDAGGPIAAARHCSSLISTEILRQNLMSTPTQTTLLLPLIVSRA